MNDLCINAFISASVQQLY